MPHRLTYRPSWWRHYLSWFLVCSLQITLTCVKLTKDNNQHAYINGNFTSHFKINFSHFTMAFPYIFTIIFYSNLHSLLSPALNRMGGSHVPACNFKTRLRIGEKPFCICLSLAYFTYHNDFPTPPILLQTPHFSLCMYTYSLSIHLLEGIPTSSISQLVWSV